MNYQQTLDWLFAQLPMYQRVGGAAYKIDLSNTRALCEHLGNPEQGFKSIHVAGTNGKGSCSHMLASVLMAAGYKVGLYTSPHLKDFRERIKINGKPIGKRAVVQFVAAHKDFFEQQQLSFFEMTVGMAFKYFEEEQVDIAVVEVGLGGRLDSTNVISPEVGIITNIGFDHMQFLGNTLESIAAEKAGIIKPGIPVVIGETTPETKKVFKTKAQDVGAPIFYAEDHPFSSYPLDLKGDYQKQNSRTVLIALEQLKKRGFNVPDVAIKMGLSQVIKTTGLLGRWQQLGESPTIIADTAHNKEGLTIVLNQLKNASYDQLHLVLGFVSDKKVADLVVMFPENARYYFCQAKIPRAMDAQELRTIFQAQGRNGKVYSSVGRALGAAKRKASKTDLIYVGGSTFTVAEVV
ncbi:MAG: bifunctional folylpolyglutamate synthase/dihydrofolate synthase [Gilvibacter sp.]|nr:folylpolyglutamate synthase/dihydrofolate synthase family protein [Gilvibacter sp.]NQX78772.1 bifunctional folylpolyglutamate synthase/dihydrofolate synthase [Gilvibacter sp.]